MDNVMMAGMGLIVGGVGMSAWGLLPRNLAQHIAASSKFTISAPEDAPLSWAHWRLMATLVVALVIDAMQPAALGFAIPGLLFEYDVPRDTVPLPPFCPHVGTVSVSFLWAPLSDAHGRQWSLLLSEGMFGGTSIRVVLSSLR